MPQIVRKIHAELRVNSLPKERTVFSLLLEKKLERRDGKDKIR